MRPFIDFNTQEFQKLVRKKILTDDRGDYEMIYDGKIAHEYILMINRRIIVSAGRVINYKHFIENYDLDKMKIRFYPNKMCMRYWEFMYPELAGRVKAL